MRDIVNVYIHIGPLWSAQGLLVPALSWKVIGWVWAYNLLWMVIQDIVKIGLYRHLKEGRSGWASLLRLWHPLDLHAGRQQHAHPRQGS